MRTAVLACLLLLGACSIARESNPPRTATEQLLLSAAIDRAVAGLKLDIPKGSLVFVDSSNFEGYDSKYAVASVAERVLMLGGRLAPDKGKADMVVAIRSGALSTDKDGFLLGVPATGMPIPLTGTVNLPELALLKKDETRGVAKFAATLYDAKTGALKSVSGASYGFSHKTHWVIAWSPGRETTPCRPASIPRAIIRRRFRLRVRTIRSRRPTSRRPDACAAGARAGFAFLTWLPFA
jgi:hypothetical protein